MRESEWKSSLIYRWSLHVQEGEMNNVFPSKTEANLQVESEMNNTPV